MLSNIDRNVMSPHLVFVSPLLTTGSQAGPVAASAYESKTIFVSNLSLDTNEEDLKQFFAPVRRSHFQSMRCLPSVPLTTTSTAHRIAVRQPDGGQTHTPG
jgi:hypothetical protein